MSLNGLRHLLNVIRGVENPLVPLPYYSVAPRRTKDDGGRLVWPRRPLEHQPNKLGCLDVASFWFCVYHSSVIVLVKRSRDVFQNLVRRYLLQPAEKLDGDFTVSLLDFRESNS